MSRMFTRAWFLLIVLVVPVIAQANTPHQTMPTTFSPEALVPPHTWPNWQFSPTENAYNFYEHILTYTNISQLKAHPLASQGIDGGWNAVLGDGMLFEGTAHSNGGPLTAVNIRNNTFGWRLQNTIEPAVTLGHLVVTQQKQTCQAALVRHWLPHTSRPEDRTCNAIDLYAFDTHTGALRWQAPLATDAYYCCQRPITANGLIYTGVRGNFNLLEAIDGATGKLVWFKQVYGTPTFWAYGEYRGQPVIYVNDGATILRAFDARTGRQVWHWTIPSPPGVQGMIFADSHLYFATITGTAENTSGYMFSLNDHGRLEWQVPTANHGWFIPAAEVNGVIYGQKWYWACPETGCQFQNDEYQSYDASTGGLIRDNFCSPGSMDGYGSTPVLANGLFFVGGFTDGGGYIGVCDVRQPGLYQTLGPSGYMQTAVPLIVDGRVYSGGLGSSSGVYFSLK